MHTKSIFDELQEQSQRGVLLVITGPSGAGKDAVISQLIHANPAIKKVVTTTSRAMREVEKEGDPYHFISRDIFEQKIADGEFFEWVEFRGELYGTQKQTLMDALSSGQDVIWKMEAKGVKNIKQKIRQLSPRSVFVFLTAPDISVMHERVVHAEGEEKAAIRWNEPLVVWEMKQFEDCDYLVVNEDGKLQETVATVQALVKTKRIEIFHEEKPEEPHL